jgi:hypothetical protein
MTVLTRVKAAVGRTALDRRLARGVDAHASPELRRRAQVLRGWRARHAFAAGIEQVVHDAEHPHRHYTAAVAVERDEVLAARGVLLRVAEALRDEPPGDVRGIAEVSLLLTDGTGPLFTRQAAGTLREAVFRAAFHLEAV